MPDRDGLFAVDPTMVVRPKVTAPVDKKFQSFDPHQVMLLPPSLNDWLPEGHVARSVAELVDEVLDLSPILALPDPRGLHREARLPAL